LRLGWRVIDAWSGRQTPCPFAAVALAVDLDDRAVIHQPVYRRHGHGAGEDVLPLAKRLVEFGPLQLVRASARGVCVMLF